MSYQKLSTHFRRLEQLGEVSAIVDWDQAVNMPSAAGQARAEAMAGLNAVQHDLLTLPSLADWFETADREAELGAWETANLHEMARRWKRATCLPSALVEKTTEACKRSEQAWRRYRAENNFKDYAPYLREVLALKREEGALLGDALGLDPYDALMDEFEPGMNAANVEKLFAKLRQELPGFVDEVIEAQATQTVEAPKGPFAIDAQRRLGLSLLSDIGFDTSRGRLDVSHHPFCGGVPQDVRITTRYDEADFSRALMGVLHEAGHGKYEQGLPSQWRHQLVGLARGMAVHESQSLLLEMQVCRSKEFAQYLTPRLIEAFPKSAAAHTDAYSADNIARLLTRVQRSYIRVDADEVTYPLHVMLRFDLERRMINGTLTVEDLPEAWDAEMNSLLSLSTAGNDRDGCMQDVHWPSGSFGYFPLYTLGAMAAAQFFAAYVEQRGSRDVVDSETARGEFQALDKWLLEHVWSKASSQSTDGLLTSATGKRLSGDALMTHLRTRYL